MKVFLVAALGAGLLIPGVALAESPEPYSAAWCADYKRSAAFAELMIEEADKRWTEAMRAGDAKRADEETEYMKLRTDQLAKRAAIYSAFCKK